MAGSIAVAPGSKWLLKKLRSLMERMTVTGKLVRGNFGPTKIIAENFGPPGPNLPEIMVRAEKFGPDVGSSPTAGL